MTRFSRVFLQKMTPTVNNKTATFEKLLRSHFKRSNGSAHCSGFDADLATAYIERKIPAATIQRYESHLAECSSCRITVANLARFDQADMAATATDKEPVRRPGWILGFLSGLATPRWALAALALLVAVISVPVIVNNMNARNHAVAFREEDAPTESNNAVPVELAKNAPPAPRDADGSQPSPVSTTASRQRTAGGTEESGPSVAAGRPASGEVAATESDKRTDREEAPIAASKDEPKKADDPATHVAERREAQPERKTSDDRAEFEKIDSARALSVPEDKSKGGEVKTLKPGSASADAKTEKERTATVKPLGELTPRASESAGSDRGRSGISAPPPQPRDENKKAVMADEVSRVSEITKTKPAKPEERRVSNKTFRLIGGVWTDKRYKPDKEIPVVPLVWDTDVYKEMLVKQAGLKAYFVGFKSDERVVLIYKGAIYKLVPPDK